MRNSSDRKNHSNIFLNLFRLSSLSCKNRQSFPLWQIKGQKLGRQKVGKTESQGQKLPIVGGAAANFRLAVFPSFGLNCHKFTT